MENPRTRSRETYSDQLPLMARLEVDPLSTERILGSKLHGTTGWCTPKDTFKTKRSPIYGMGL